MSDVLVWARVMGWSLLLALLQGAVLAGIVGLVARHVSAAMRSRIALLAQLVLFGLFAGSAVVLFLAWRTGGSELPHVLASAGSAPSALHLATSAFTGRPDLVAVLRGLDVIAIVLSVVWLTGAAWLLLRVIVQWRRSRSLLRKGRVRWDLEPLLLEVGQRIGLRRLVLPLQGIAYSPAVLGWLKPALVIPSHTERVLSREQLRAIVAHELAHVRRGDYCLFILESVVRALLFPQPAAWWLTRFSRRAREEACDDVAVLVCGDRLLYARALERLESARDSRTLRPALTVALHDGELLGRIRHVLQTGRSSDNSRWWSVLSPVGVAVLCAAVVLPVVAAPAVPLARLRDRFMHIDAHDPVGRFTVTIFADRVVGATIGGRSVAPERLRRIDDRLHILRADGTIDFTIFIRPQGISWKPRRQVAAPS